MSALSKGELESGSIRTKYFDWLYSKIGFDDETDDREQIFPYHIVTLQLFMKEFYPMVPYDENRDTDARTLRDRFVYEADSSIDAGVMLDILSGPANLLEVMVALAERMDNDLYNPENRRNKIVDSFWELFKNLGLDRFKDDGFAVSWMPDEVCKIVGKVLDRTYEPNGRGGFFPLEHPKEDQRKVELWYQMQAWLIENYGLEE